MPKRQLLTFLAWLSAALCLAFGLGIISNSGVVSQGTKELTVSAAASLRDALQEIKPLYTKTQPQTKITYNFGSSGSLQQQIEQGAPVDIFIAAAAKQMAALESKNLLLTGSRKNLLTNRIVLITPEKFQGVTNFKDLTKAEVKSIAIGEPKSVPAGQYGQETLKFYGILEQIKPKLIYAKDVRQVLTYVESENVEAGLVYATDAKTSQAVKIVATAPKNAHTPIVYPVAIIKDSKQTKAAQDFLNFLSSKPAQTVFTKYGFGLAK